MYYEQEKYYTCACACFRMVLSHFNMEVPTEEFLEKEMNTAPSNTGTHYNDIIKIGRDYGFEVKDSENGTIEEIDNLTKDGWVVCLGISLDVPHFVIYLEHNDNHIFFNDPFRGERSNFLLKKFMRNHWRINNVMYRRVEKDYPDVTFNPELNRDKYWIAFKK